MGEATITYAYDVFGRRVARLAPEGDERYLYGDPDHPFRLTHLVSGSQLTSLYYDDLGYLVSMSSDDGELLVVSDPVGSPVAVLDAGGVPIKTLEYDSFGRVVADSAPDVRIPIGFAGGLLDPTTGFVRMGLRDYDPRTGRWTTRDPVRFAGGQWPAPVAASGIVPRPQATSIRICRVQGAWIPPPASE